MSEASPSGKSGAKDRIQNALLGLALALSIWIILNTINPNLLNLDFTRSLREAGVIANNNANNGTGPTTGAGVTNNPNDPTCTSCIPLVGDPGGTADIPTKTPTQTVHSTMKQKLLALKAATDALQPPLAYGWRVTEGFPPAGYTPQDPTGLHTSTCHGNGKCVDINFVQNGGAVSQPTVAETKRFADIMVSVGLIPLYESADVSFVDQLSQAGVSADYNAHITGNHFHVKY